MEALVKGLDGTSEIGLWGKGDGSAFSDKGHGFGCMETEVGDEEESDCRGRSLNPCGTMDEDGSALLVLSKETIRDFGGPKFHVSDFGLLEIVVYRNTIGGRNQWGEGAVFGAVKYDLDAMSVEKGGVHGGLCIS